MAATHRILGTAGHIDHGKSALVRALTGTDPDRLAEEKERGITIELGFAQLTLPDGSTMGVVDVPGHERFVRQMISGSTGIDVALLCIAADDGVMPQTREHTAVLELLGIPACVVALTKCDRVDEEWLEFATEEVRSYLATTSFADAPIVATSSRTGQGLDELKAVLLDVARRCEARHASELVRMPIDRVFTVKGAGTVVTGTLWSGEVSLDDELEVLPGGKRARVRSIQMHDMPAESAEASNRVALNLGALKTSEIRPGDFLSAPGTLEATDRFDAWFTHLTPLREGKPLKSGTTVRIAHGTREVFGRMLFMNGREAIEPHASDYAQIRLEDPLPLSSGDRFIVRSESPVGVIGGGIALACRPRRRTTLSTTEFSLLEALRAGNESEAVQRALDLQTAPVAATDIAEAVGIAPERARRALDRFAENGSALRIGPDAAPFYTTCKVVQRGLGTLENTLLSFHTANPAEPGVHKNDLLLRSGLRMSPTAFDALVALAQESGKVVVENGLVSHPKAGAGAKQLERQTAERVSALLADAHDAPPAVEDIPDKLGIERSFAYRVLNALEKDGRIVRVGKSLAFDAEAFAQLERAAVAYLEAKGQATVAELKDALKTTRKYAVPLLEAFDERGITTRDGDVRTLGPNR